MNAAERACDALERDMMQRIATEYGEATLRSIRNLDAFFADVEALDRKKPPSVYRTAAQQERWRQREMRKLLEKHNAESVVSRQLEEAGDTIAALIVLYRIGLFCETSNGTAREINRQQKSFPAIERIRVPEPFPGAALPDLVHAKTSHRFTQQEREIEIILRGTQTPFSKASIKNLKAAPALRRRLRNEMTQAVLKGESQQQLAKRIERVMQSGAYNARRIAQTERTRVQSQAAWDVMAQSEQLGVNMAKKWHAKMVNTRDSHAALNGAIAPLHEPFHAIWGNDLMYPGDPSAPASEVINCHCGISPVVLRPGEKIQPTPTPSGKVARDTNSGIIITDRQFGRKAGKHMAEWGLNPSDEKDREVFASITKNIQNNPQEVRRVQWLYDPETKKRTVEVNCYILGADVVLMKDNGEYITTMKNGVDNKRVKNGRRIG